MRGATPLILPFRIPKDVSIHAPHAGRDRTWAPCVLSLSCFNPRAPCGARLSPTDSFVRWTSFNPRAPCGARLYHNKKPMSIIMFQSTRPMRGATRPSEDAQPRRWGFNPRAPCGARPARSFLRSCRPCFNPRAPCGARPVLRGMSISCSRFNPRAPCGARQMLWYLIQSS